MENGDSSPPSKRLKTGDIVSTQPSPESSAPQSSEPAKSDQTPRIVLEPAQKPDSSDSGSYEPSINQMMEETEDQTLDLTNSEDSESSELAALLKVNLFLSRKARFQSNNF